MLLVFYLRFYESYKLILFPFTDFKPPSDHGNRTKAIILAVGIASGVLVVFLIMLAVLRSKGLLGGKDPVYKGMEYATNFLKFFILFLRSIFVS
jgi:hypothetical protein